jgi:hypothetical protein
MNKNNNNLTKKLVASMLENLDYIPKTKNTGNGYDERHETSNETDTEMLTKIKTNMKKLDLLRKLQDNRTSFIEKLELIEIHDRTFGENSVRHNISAGGLWKDFNTEIF